MALISTSRRGICAECAERSSCSFESALGKDVPEEVFANNPVGASPGDHVEFELPGRTELKLSFLIWAVPVIGLMTGAILGHRLLSIFSLSNNAATLIGAVIGLIFAVLPVVAYDRRIAKNQKLIPSITRITRTPCEKVDSS